MSELQSQEIVRNILSRKSDLAKSKLALRWFFVNFVLTLMIFVDLKYGSISRYFESYTCFWWYFESFLGIIFALNTLFDLLTYLRPVVAMSPVKVNPIQKKLFRVDDKDIGFETSTPKSKDAPTQDSPSNATRRSFCLPSMQSNVIPSSPSSYLSPPLDYSTHASWGSSSPNLSLSTSSWKYYHGSSPHSTSQMHFNQSPSQHSANLNDSSNLRQRLSSSYTAIVNTSDHVIKDEKSLDQYLAECEQKEQLKQLVNSDASASPVPSVWSYQRSVGEMSLPLQKYQYQPASRSPQFSAANKDDNSSATHSGDGIWTKLKVSDRTLNSWIENLRKWLTQTVIMRLVSEINGINETLTRLGSAELQIGETSLSTLRQVAITKSQHLPTITAVLPYLDMTLNQEYLVQRLKDLAKGGCMSAFRWNGGGSYKGKPWTEDLPTDSAIVMHLFCTYLDSRLPPNPHYPDWKTFSSQYFRKTPDKPAVGKDSLCIYQSRIYPPHYQLIIGGDTWDLPKGRNNLLYTVLLFLYHVKTEHCGMLGRVNLGPSGINVLWVIET